ncbi:penicillin acylase family protein [Actinophytocola algeriensis]|uniref:Acyl-homoserine-lactone acylase n=1 Tax=Actinophytocola algeriensis TaxID=1768010 RepID=A0A7W7Q1F2_9PSEU|nr:penicillin acylase family protein [Actinophytocola algeriensis]MBB4905073.1 acyl-homoserine-lactone acylase [Actinophytocola algeriensis]MBE1473242.1 acyl-homoserine-lactone acylase [Actinophytocola algeriensis]
MRRGIHTVAVLTAAATVLTMVSGMAAGAPAGTELREGRGLAADIRYTEYGIPHIKAKDFAGLGYGYGFAAAQDNVCVLADTYLTVDAQRAKYLGPDAPANTAFGAARDSLASDLYFQQVNDSRVVERAVAAQDGPREEVRELVRGYVAGYNRWLRDTGVSRISDPACRGAAWVRPIRESQVYRHFHALSTIAGQGQVIDSIAAAAPPTAPSTPAPVPPDAAERVRAALGDRADMGSNAIAVGKDGTANGRGLLLGNPHYPWHGGRRFWQSQLTVPGKLDVSGGSLLGIPMIQIGFNKDVAWSHTVATPTTFGLYEVRLAPGDPTTYLVDGKAERMTSRRVRVEVRQEDGSTGTVERTLYSTRYGPVLSPVFGLPLDWTTATAYTIRDANQGNMRGLNTWFDLARTRSTKDVVHVLSRTQGVPWVNTIATDQSGRALFADIQVVPHVTDELAARCNTTLGKAIFPRSGISVLDGARGDCAWGRDRDALVPGTFGPSRMPVLTRSDYVANSNDSAWLANPHQPITGYPRIIGDIGTERAPRTRMGITAVEERLGSFTRRSMQDLLFADRSFVGEREASAVAELCAALPGGQAPTSGGGTVPVGDACTALSEWDRTMRTGSRGALLFEQFWLRAADALEAPDLWRVPFDPADPVATPNTLDTANPAVAVALGDAIAELRAAGIAPDAPLGENHYVVRNGERIPIHGGHNAHGVLNMIIPAWDPAAGDVEVVHGSSHIQTVSFTGGRCPDATTLLTYSQSSNPKSPHFADQTKLFSAGKWVRSRFCEGDILSSPALKVVRLR